MLMHIKVGPKRPYGAPATSAMKSRGRYHPQVLSGEPGASILEAMR